MKNEVRIQYLKQVLFVKVILTIFLWGLPAFLAPNSLLSLLNLPVPVEPIYLRLFGAAAIAWGVAYWYAYKDPVRNVAILKAGLVDNALPTIAVIWFGVTGVHSSVFIWISGLFTGLFFLSLLLLIPRQVEAHIS
jgi:hypothetical protein